MIEIEKIELTAYCLKGEGDTIVQQMINSVPADCTVLGWSNSVDPVTKDIERESVILATPPEILDQLEI